MTMEKPGMSRRHLLRTAAVGVGENRRTLKERLALQFSADIQPLDDIWQQEIRVPPTLKGELLWFLCGGVKVNAKVNANVGWLHERGNRYLIDPCRKRNRT